jgi:hypothetical protein
LAAKLETDHDAAYKLPIALLRKEPAHEEILVSIHCSGPFWLAVIAPVAVANFNPYTT